MYLKMTVMKCNFYERPSNSVLTDGIRPGKVSSIVTRDQIATDTVIAAVRLPAEMQVRQWRAEKVDIGT